jgi:hypothetical protein
LFLPFSASSSSFSSLLLSLENKSLSIASLFLFGHAKSLAFLFWENMPARGVFAFCCVQDRGGTWVYLNPGHPHGDPER